ncbi:hypothetical protein [Vibrio sp. Hep-1b-8]|uniref:hypothetical protein n=1 Tax=Vibrio sp. Hep-1b-8 TaxID=2144187 RepID=UPI001485F5E3|nr:hypothetical protein [Vibrio sp. Hep-1b-8]
MSRFLLLFIALFSGIASASVSVFTTNGGLASATVSPNKVIMEKHNNDLAKNLVGNL